MDECATFFFFFFKFRNELNWDSGESKYINTKLNIEEARCDLNINEPTLFLMYLTPTKKLKCRFLLLTPTSASATLATPAPATSPATRESVSIIPLFPSVTSVSNIAPAL